MHQETDWTDRSDEELVACWQAGGPDADRAGTALLERYRLRVYRWCRGYVRDHETAQDLAQDVLLKAWRNLPGLRGAFGPWLFVIVRNSCLGELRKRQVRAGEVVDPDDLAATDPDPEEALQRELDAGAFRTLLARTLEPVERQAIGLRCFEHMPVDMITRVLGITAASGARGVLQTARRKLRAALDRAATEDEEP